MIERSSPTTDPASAKNSKDVMAPGAQNPVGVLMERVRANVGSIGAADDDTKALRDEDDDANPVSDVDLLAAAVADVAAHYGRSISIAALTSGIALQGGRLPVEHVGDAAVRAGLVAELADVNLAALSQSDLPIACLMKCGGVEILWRIESDDAGKPSIACLTVPGRRDLIVRISMMEFVDAATNKAIRFKPDNSLDQRGEEALKQPRKNWFFSALGESRVIYFEAILATVAINILALAMPLFSMNVYDRVLPNAAEATLWALAGGVMLATVFDFIIRTLRAHYVDLASRRADVRLSALIYSRLVGARLAGRTPSAGVRANTLREFETLRDFFNSATLTAFGDLPFVFLFIAVMAIVAGPLALVLIASIPVILIVGWLTQRKLQRLVAQSFQEAAQKSAVAVETIIGLEAIKAAGAESWAAQKWEASIAEHIRTGFKIRHVSNLGQHIISALQTIIQVIIVIVGFYLTTIGELTMGALIAATILGGRALAPLAQAAMLLARFNQVRLAYQMLNDIVNSPQDRAVGQRYLNKTDFTGEVAFEKATFGYLRDLPPAVVDFDALIKPGEHVAILGGIGSGKTTVLKLVHGLFAPQRGRVLIDSVAVTQIEPAQVRRNVGLYLQGNLLFHGTIRENITLGQPLASDEDVIAAARAAAAMEWISRLPQGFDTQVGERGAGLSGGQRQSVALARALLGRPRVVLLDEPTSEMDGRTEQQFVKNLKAELAGRTMILVTHRPALLALADRVLVMELGRKVEDGPKNEVLKKLRAIAENRAASGTALPVQAKATVRAGANATQPRALSIRVPGGVPRAAAPAKESET